MRFGLGRERGKGGFSPSQKFYLCKSRRHEGLKREILPTQRVDSKGVERDEKANVCFFKEKLGKNRENEKLPSRGGEKR